MGGGDGGVLREMARYKCIEEIHMAEIDGCAAAASLLSSDALRAMAFTCAFECVHMIKCRCFCVNCEGLVDYF